MVTKVGRGTGVEGGGSPALSLGVGAACHKPTHGKVWTGLPLVGEGGQRAQLSVQVERGPDQDWRLFTLLG